MDIVYYVFIAYYAALGYIAGVSSLGVPGPDFGRSVNPISTRGDRLCPPNYYWHPRIFRPSDGLSSDILTYAI